jgi:hypothetical protein
MQMVAASLFSGTWKPQEKTGWTGLQREAVAQSVFTLVYPVAEADIPPEEEKGRIHVGYHRTAEKGRTGSVWELHRDVNGIPHGSSAEGIIRAYMADLLETPVDYEEENGTVKVPDAFHHGLTLLLHTASHLTGEGVGLRHLCDWLVFADHFSEPDFTELFEDRLKKQGCGGSRSC